MSWSPFSQWIFFSCVKNSQSYHSYSSWKNSLPSLVPVTMQRRGSGLAMPLDDGIEHELVIAVGGGMEAVRDLPLLVERHRIAVHLAVGRQELLAGGELQRQLAGPGGHGLVDDGLCGLDEFLHPHRRERLHVADRVETVTNVVGGEGGSRIEIDAHQIADRVLVLGAIEAANGDAARIEILRIGAEGAGDDPLVEGLLVIGRQATRVFGHDAGAGVS